MQKYKYRILTFLLILGFVVGCGQRASESTNPSTQTSSYASAQLTKDAPEASNDSIKEDPATGNKFVVLSTGLKGEGSGNIGKLTPYAIDGINTAIQQGSANSTQDMIKDGALRVDEAGNLSLMVFLRSNSMVKFNDNPPYVKGSRDAGFLWSCVQSKLESGLDKGNFESGQKEQLHKLIKNFRVTFFNSEGHELNVIMPGNSPILALNGQEITESQEMHQKLVQFFAATF